VAASDSDDEEIKLPVMFGDGRVRRVGYTGIKRTHAPNLVITEVSPIKRHLHELADRWHHEGHPIDDERFARAHALVDALVVEAAEALAGHGDYWPKPGEPTRADAAIVENYRWYRVVLDEEEILTYILLEYAEDLGREGQRELQHRLVVAAESFTRLARMARRRDTGW
jgi:hypothetical protein